MIFIVLGIYALLGLATGSYLIQIGRKPYSWQQRLPAPRAVSEIPYSVDYSVGNV
jgi:hypothetical protein